MLKMRHDKIHPEDAFVDLYKIALRSNFNNEGEPLETPVFDDRNLPYDVQILFNKELEELQRNQWSTPSPRAFVALYSYLENRTNLDLHSLPLEITDLYRKYTNPSDWKKETDPKNPAAGKQQLELF